MVRILLVFAVLLFAMIASGETSVAQSTGDTAAQPQAATKIDKRKLLVQPRNSDGSLQQVSFFEDPVLWIRNKQQSFYGAMSGAIRQIKGGSAYAATWTLLTLSFSYGIFHAAGPGHGKAVISAWLLATENELRRGILIAFLSSVIQALTAIVIVTVLFLVVSSVGSTARNVAGLLESASYAMIGAMGLYLIWTAIRPFLQPRPVATASTGSGPDFTFEITHNDREQERAMPLAGGSGHEHKGGFTLVNRAPGDHHQHDENCGCGHAHVPEASQLRGDWSLAKAFSLAFAVGLRPCTGAILVLVFANALGLYWAGIASALVMALGTFITVSVIAGVAVYSKKLALRYAARSTRWMNWTAFGLRLGGGAVIAGLGGLLFLGSLGSVNAMM